MQNVARKAGCFPILVCLWNSFITPAVPLSHYLNRSFLGQKLAILRYHHYVLSVNHLLIVVEKCIFAIIEVRLYQHFCRSNQKFPNTQNTHWLYCRQINCSGENCIQVSKLKLWRFSNFDRLERVHVQSCLGGCNFDSICC